jgi:hypothetical protein
MGPTAEAMANGLQEPAMRIGAEFQVAIPDMSEFHSTTDPDSMSQGSGSILVWTPNPNLKTEYLDGYLKVAKEQFGYGMEQALGLLYWHKYNIEKAVEDLSNFCPIQEEWNMEDKVTFEQAFQYHGKNFQRIRTMLPEKPISGLVKYYYLWKRSYSQYSLMDKHAKKNGRRIVSSGQLPNNDDADSTGSWSTNDTLPFSQPTTVLLSSKGKQLPRGIHLHTTELVAVSSDVERGQIRQLDKEIKNLKERIQTCKQSVSGKISPDNVEHLRPQEYSRKMPLGEAPGGAGGGGGGSGTCKWSEEEIEIALDVVRKNGKNYEALANSLDDKTVAQCRNFFTNYKRKLNLPRIIAEYETRTGRKHSRYVRGATVSEKLNCKTFPKSQPFSVEHTVLPIIVPYTYMYVCMYVGAILNL